jgi:hypothetical protein
MAVFHSVSKLVQHTAAKFNLKMKKRVEIHHRIKFLGRKLLIKLTWRCECARKLSSRVSCCFWNRVIMALVQCTRGPEEPLPKEPSDVFHYCITTEREHPLSHSARKVQRKQKATRTHPWHSGASLTYIITANYTNNKVAKIFFPASLGSRENKSKQHIPCHYFFAPVRCPGETQSLRVLHIFPPRFSALRMYTYLVK